MLTHLPRVTYSNTGTDFSLVHDRLDQLIPRFEAGALGRTWVTAFATGPSHCALSPIDGALFLGGFPTSTDSDVTAAIAAANAAHGEWSARSLADRLDFALRWEQALGTDKYNLALAALYEIGKSRIEAVGEAEECLDMVAYYRGEIELRHGYAQSMNELVRNETTRSVLRPYGVFGVISPFNFPLALSVNMICGALLTGNAVVYKPSQGCALTGLMLAETLNAAGLPQGVFNIVLGGPEVGEAIVSSTDVDGIAFTGSYNTGMGIFRQLVAQEHAKPLIADMGGKNPAYVSRTADIAIAAEGVARSAFGLQGQKCSACSVVYVDRAIKDEFVDAIKAFAATLRVGDPRAREQFMGPLYNEQTVVRFTDALDEARSNGKVYFGGNRIEGLPGNYFAPAIVELEKEGRLTKDELFMPFLVIRAVDDLRAGIEEGNDVNYGLAAGVYSQDQADIDYFMTHAEAGVLYANRASGATTGAWPGSQPFCGWKGSGVTGKGGLGPHYLPQFAREQSRTVMHKR